MNKKILWSSLIVVTITLVIILTLSNKTDIYSQDELADLEKSTLFKNTNDKTELKINNNEIVNEAENNIKENKESADELTSNYIAECENSLELNELVNQKYSDSDRHEIANNVDELVPILEQSDDIYSKITHALITGKGDTNKLTENLSELRQKHPDNPMLSYDLLSACTSSGTSCERDQITSGVNLDKQNGAVWLLSSIYEINNNNIDAATEALLEAAYAPTYEEYWGGHFTLFETAFSQAGVGSEMSSQIATIDQISSIPLPNYSVIASFCKGTELAKVDIIEACISLGKRLVDNKGNMISYLIGLSIQKEIYNKYGDEYQLSLITAQEKKFRNNMRLSEKALNLHMHSHQRATNWLNYIKYTGEVYTNEYIVDEAIRLSSIPEFDPCELDW